jgi:flagellar hook-length control protein FliK
LLRKLIEELRTGILAHIATVSAMTSAAVTPGTGKAGAKIDSIDALFGVLLEKAAAGNSAAPADGAAASAAPSSPPGETSPDPLELMALPQNTAAGNSAAPTGAKSPSSSPQTQTSSDPLGLMALLQNTATGQATPVRQASGMAPAASDAKTVTSQDKSGTGVQNWGTNVRSGPSPAAQAVAASAQASAASDLRGADAPSAARAPASETSDAKAAAPDATTASTKTTAKDSKSTNPPTLPNTQQTAVPVPDAAMVIAASFQIPTPPAAQSGLATAAATGQNSAAVANLAAASAVVHADGAANKSLTGAHATPDGQQTAMADGKAASDANNGRQASPSKSMPAPSVTSSSQSKSAAPKDSTQPSPQPAATQSTATTAATTSSPAANPLTAGPQPTDTALVPGVAGAQQPAVAGPSVAAQIQVSPQHHDFATASATDALALAIATKSVDGVRHFDIRLDPPELGRVQVHLSVDATGTAQAHLVVDKPQTLEMLQRDAPNLNRALTDAGLDLSNNGLNFSLREQYRQNDGGGVDQGRGRALSVKAVVQTDASQTLASIASLAPNSVRLDIRV